MMVVLDTFNSEQDLRPCSHPPHGTARCQGRFRRKIEYGEPDKAGQSVRHGHAPGAVLTS